MWWSQKRSYRPKKKTPISLWKFKDRLQPLWAIYCATFNNLIHSTSYQAIWSRKVKRLCGLTQFCTAVRCEIQGTGMKTLYGILNFQRFTRGDIWMGKRAYNLSHTLMRVAYYLMQSWLIELSKRYTLGSDTKNKTKNSIIYLSLNR